MFDTSAASFCKDFFLSFFLNLGLSPSLSLPICPQLQSLLLSTNLLNYMDYKDPTRGVQLLSPAQHINEMDIVYFPFFLTPNQWLRSLMTAAVWWWCEQNFAVSCSAEKVRKQRERGQTGKLSVNCWCVTAGEDILYIHRNVDGEEEKNSDSDRDKPSSHQTRRLYSGAGGVRTATSELPVEGPIRLYLSFCWFSSLIGEAKEWDLK